MRFIKLIFFSVIITLIVSYAIYTSGQEKAPVEGQDSKENEDTGDQETLDLNGLWGTNYGEMVVKHDGMNAEGVLAKPNDLCTFKKGAKILKGLVMEDMFTGDFLMCQGDEELCGGPVWTTALLLIADRGNLLTGSSSSKDAKCPLVGFSKSDEGEKGLYFRKLKKLSKKDAAAGLKASSGGEEGAIKNILMPGPPAPPGTYDPRAAIKTTPAEKGTLREGKALMDVGKFEQARKVFEKVLESDRSNPKALEGIGVTYYARNEYDEALEYYKKALASDPNHADVYYNMACIYALQNKKDMAIEYLEIALMNNFVPPKDVDKDPDLESVRKTPEYKGLMRDGAF